MSWPHAIEHRLAAPRDAPRLHEIYSDPETAPHMAFDPCTSDQFADLFHELRTPGELWVAQSDGILHGVYHLQRGKHRLRHVAHVGAVAVSAEVRGRGFARAMMQHALARLEHAGAVRIELSASADNHRAIAFWRGLGFRPEGTHRAYFTRAGSPGFFDEVSMARVKSPPA